MSAPQPPYGPGYPQQGQPQNPQPGYPPQQPAYPPQGQPPSPPQGYPQQPQGYPPPGQPPQAQPPQSQPQGYPQQQPGYPPQQYPQQQPYGGYPPQQPYGGSPLPAYIAGGLLILEALLLIILAVEDFDAAASTMGGIIRETNAGLTDALLWVLAVTTGLTALGALASAGLFLIRSYLTPRVVLTAGGLGILVLVVDTVTVLVARANEGSYTSFADIDIILCCLFGISMVVMGFLPQTRAALKPKPQQTPQYQYQNPHQYQYPR